jgi:hypothetical protein
MGYVFGGFRPSLETLGPSGDSNDLFRHQSQQPLDKVTGMPAATARNLPFRFGHKDLAGIDNKYSVLKASSGVSRRFSDLIAISRFPVFLHFHFPHFYFPSQPPSNFFLFSYYFFPFPPTTTITTHPIMTDNTKKNLLDASGSEPSKDDATATAILRRKKKDNGMYFFFFIYM